MRIDKNQLKYILFLDIETVPQKKNFEELSDIEKKLWENKTAYQRKEEFTPEEFYDRAGILAEFGKIVCISVGFFQITNTKREFRIKSFVGEEPTILKEFKALVEKYFSHTNNLFCAHNGKEFDFPYIARRMIINSIPLPDKLDLQSKKPWEVPYLDTLELWKFGDRKNYTSLDLLTHTLGVPSPKNDIDGSQVAQVFYEEANGIERIKTYCEKDVLALVQVFLRLSTLPILEEKEVLFV